MNNRFSTTKCSELVSHNIQRSFHEKNNQLAGFCDADGVFSERFWVRLVLCLSHTCIAACWLVFVMQMECFLRGFGYV